MARKQVKPKKVGMCQKVDGGQNDDGGRDCEMSKAGSSSKKSRSLYTSLLDRGHEEPFLDGVLIMHYQCPGPDGYNGFVFREQRGSMMPHL